MFNVFLLEPACSDLDCLGSAGWGCGGGRHGDVTIDASGSRGETANSPLFPQTSSNNDWAAQFGARLVGAPERRKRPRVRSVLAPSSAWLGGHPPRAGLRADVTAGGHAPRVVTQARKIARRGRGRSVGRRTDSSQQLQRKHRYISHTIRSNQLPNTQNHHAHIQNGGPRATGAKSQAGRAVRRYGSCHEVGKSASSSFLVTFVL